MPAANITVSETPLVLYTLRRADDALILGHRLSEWCGHAPMLEEDMALANMGLDLLGQARELYSYAAKVEGRGNDEDKFAYLRDVLIPSGRLSGWSPDWYAGFPAYQFYMVVPSLLIVLLDVVLPYGIAFKVVTISGVIALPVAAWAFGKLARLPFPTPPLLAAGATAFLFDRSFSIYGGNIASTLAGEFAVLKPGDHELRHVGDGGRRSASGGDAEHLEGVGRPGAPQVAARHPCPEMLRQDLAGRGRRHAERREDVPVHVIVVTLAAHALNEVACQGDAVVAVGRHGARGVDPPRHPRLEVFLR